MGIRAERDRANAVIADHLGEPVTVAGHCLKGIPREDPSTSSGLSIQVKHFETQVDIRTADAARIKLARGMVVEWIGIDGELKKGRARNFEPLSSGWTAIEVEV